MLSLGWVNMAAITKAIIKQMVKRNCTKAEPALLGQLGQIPNTKAKNKIKMEPNSQDARLPDAQYSQIRRSLIQLLILEKKFKKNYKKLFYSYYKL